MPPARRGHFLEVPPAPVEAAEPGPLAPSVRRSTRRFDLSVRHGEFLTPPRPHETPLPPVRPPDLLGAPGARRSPFVRRGRFQVFTEPQPAPGPRLIRRRGDRPPLAPRGRIFGLPGEPLPPPQPAPLVPVWYRRHRSRLLPIHRGCVARIALGGGLAPAPAWPPRPGSVTLTDPAVAGSVRVTEIATAGNVTVSEIATAGAVTTLT